MATYYVWSGAAGGGNGTTWALAYQTLALAFAGKASGDVFYVAHDHAESSASALTLTTATNVTNPAKVICVNRAGSVPPVSADRRATAQVTTTGASTITTAGTTHYDGIIFNTGTGSSAAALTLCPTASSWQRFDNCALRILTTAITSTLIIGAASVGGISVELNNTTVSFAATNQGITSYARLKWRNTPSALLGTIPSILFIPGPLRGGSVDCIGIDFSAAGAGKTIAGVVGPSQGGAYTFVDCKLDAAVTKAVAATVPGTVDIDFIRSGATGNYTVFSNRMSGTLDHETTIIRTGGASDGTTGISWKVTTSANSTYSVPFECPPIAIWNDTVGSVVTATVEGVWGGGAVPNDDDVWLDVEYLGDASSPQGSFVNDGKADLLAAAAAQASSSATWGGSTTRFKLGVTFTPQQKGWIYARVKCAKLSSTFYIDPLITLT